MEDLTPSAATRPDDLVTLLKRSEVERRTALSRSSLYRLIERGEFPNPVQLSARAVAWRSSDVAAWIASRSVGVRSVKA